MGPRAQATLTARWAGNAAFRAAGRSMRRLAADSAYSARALNSFNRSVTRAMRGVMRFFTRQASNIFRSFFFGIRIWAIMAGFAISGFAGSAIKSFREFDKKLRETTSLIAGGALTTGKGSMRKRMQEAKKVAQQEYEAYRREMLAMSVPLRQTPQGLTGGLREIVSAGYTGRGRRARAVTTQLLTAAATGATAGDADVETSTRLLIQTMNALGLTSRRKVPGGTGYSPLTGKMSPMAIMDKFFQTMNYGVNIRYPDLASSMGNVIGPIGAVLNPAGKRNPKRGAFALDQILGSVIVASQRGYTAAKTTIGLQDILKSIAKPTNQAQDVYKELGLTPGSALLQGGLIGTGGALTKIDRALQKFKKSGGDASTALNTLFGNVRGLRIATTLMNTDLSDVNEALMLLVQSQGAAKIAFDETGKSLDGQIQRFESLFETVKVGVGVSLMPFLQRAMSFGERLLTKISGGEAGMTANALYYQARAGDKSLTPEQFAQTLPEAQAEAFMRYRAFASANFKSIVRQLFDTVSGELRNWWNSGGRETFTNLVKNLANTAVKALGELLLKADDIYTFGIKLGTKIFEGIWQGFSGKMSGAAGQNGGILGLLRSGQNKKLLNAETGGQSLLGGLLGLGAFGLLGPAMAKRGGLMGRTQLGALGGTAVALGGGSAAASVIAAIVSGLVGPQIFGALNGQRGQSLRQRLLGGASSAVGGSEQFSIQTAHISAGSVYVNGAAGVAGAGPRGRAAASGVSPMTTTAMLGGTNGRSWMLDMQRRMRYTSLDAVRQRMWNTTATVGDPISYGPGGNARDRRRYFRSQMMERYGTAQPPAYSSADTPAWLAGFNRRLEEIERERRGPGLSRRDRLRGRFGNAASAIRAGAGAAGGSAFRGLRGVGRFAGGGGGAAVAAASLGMLGAAGGGTNSMIGAGVGGGLGALGFLVPGAGPVLGPLLMMLGSMGGGMLGGYLDQRQSAADSAASQARMQQFVQQFQAGGYGSRSQAAYALAQAATGQKIGIRRVGGQMTAAPGAKGGQATFKPGSGRAEVVGLSPLAGLIGEGGMATTAGVNTLMPAIEALLNTSSSKQLPKAISRLDKALVAVGADANLVQFVATMYQEHQKSILENETATAFQRQQKRRIKRINKQYADSPNKHLQGRDPMAVQQMMGEKRSKLSDVIEVPAAADVSKAAETLIQGYGGQVEVSMNGLVPQITNSTADVFVAMAQPGSASYVEAQAAGGVLGRTFLTSMQNAINSNLNLNVNAAMTELPNGTKIGARGLAYGARGFATRRTNVMAANGRQLVIGEDGAEAIVPLSQRVGGKRPQSGTVAVNFNGPVTFASDQDVEQVAEKLSQRLRAVMNNSTHLNSKGR